MTEPLDVEALRKLIDKHGAPLSPGLIYTLLDEIEATRAERDGWHLNADLCEQRLDEERARADRAEAERDGYAKQCLIHIAAAETAETLQANAAAYNTQLTHRAEKAEAAIARIEALCDPAVANPSEAAIYKAAVRATLGGPE